MGLMDRGYITPLAAGQGLPQCLRITIGTAQQMDAIADILRAMAVQAG